MPKRKFPARPVLSLCAALLALAGGAHAETGIATPATARAALAASRWHEAFEAFAAADRAHAPEAGGVLFVGSSSIRLWDGLETQFDAPHGVLKRGFGGSSLADCAQYVDRLVLPYRPRTVVLYAGDNDLAEGRTPEEVFASYRRFVEAVQAALPETRIAYVSIKPSPLRESLLPRIRAANGLIAGYVAAHPGLDYIDVYSRMVDAEGHPRRDLFRADALHLNADGYKLWKTVIAGHLR